MPTLRPWSEIETELNQAGASPAFRQQVEQEYRGARKTWAGGAITEGVGGAAPASGQERADLLGLKTGRMELGTNDEVIPHQPSAAEIALSRLGTEAQSVSGLLRKIQRPAEQAGEAVAERTSPYVGETAGRLLGGAVEYSPLMIAGMLTSGGAPAAAAGGGAQAALARILGRTAVAGGEMAGYELMGKLGKDVERGTVPETAAETVGTAAETAGQGFAAGAAGHLLFGEPLNYLLGKIRARRGPAVAPDEGAGAEVPATGAGSTPPGGGAEAASDTAIAGTLMRAQRATELLAELRRTVEPEAGPELPAELGPTYREPVALHQPGPEERALVPSTRRPPIAMPPDFETPAPGAEALPGAPSPAQEGLAETLRGFGRQRQAEQAASMTAEPPPPALLPTAEEPIPGLEAPPSEAALPPGALPREPPVPLAPAPPSPEAQADVLRTVLEETKRRKTAASAGAKPDLVEVRRLAGLEAEYGTQLSALERAMAGVAPPGESPAGAVPGAEPPPPAPRAPRRPRPAAAPAPGVPAVAPPVPSTAAPGAAPTPGPAAAPAAVSGAPRPSTRARAILQALADARRTAETGQNAAGEPLPTRLVESARESVPRLEEQLAAEQGRPRTAHYEPGEEPDVPTEPGPVPTGPPTRKGDIVRELSAALNVPIRTGKLGRVRRTVRAILRQPYEVIRMRSPGDVPAAAHEAGHVLASRGVVPRADIEAARAELLPLATRAAPGTGALEEGLSQFVNLFVTDPARAARVAPGFHARFLERIRDHSGIEDALRTARQDWQRWQTQGPVARVLGHLATEQPAMDSLMPWYSKVYAGLWSRGHAVTRFTRAAAMQGLDIPAEQNPDLLARLHVGWIGKGVHFLYSGPFRFRDLSRIEGGKSLQAISGPFAGDPATMDAYLTALHARDLHALGYKTGISPADAAETVRLLDSPRTAQLAAETKQYTTALLRYWQDGGGISRERADALLARYPHYVPFNRVLEEVPGFAESAGVGITGAGSPVKQLRGSEREIIAPTQGLIRYTYAMIGAAERNRVRTALVDLANRGQGLGRWVEQIPSGKPGSVSAAQDRLSSILQVWRNGHVERYQLHPELFAAVDRLDPGDLNLLVRVLGAPKQWVASLATTYNPEFPLGNLIRDQFAATVVKGHRPLVDFAQGVATIVGQREPFWEFLRSGAAHATYTAMERDFTKGTAKALLSGKRYGNELAVNKPWAGLAMFSQLFEEATRVGEFARERPKAPGLRGMVQAGMAARDVTVDFGRYGAWMRSFNAMVPFLNPGMQGLDWLGRMWKADPVGVTVRGAAAITVPSLLLWAANRDDGRVAEVPLPVRDLFWVIPSEHVSTAEWAAMSPQDRAAFDAAHPMWRIPKPRELGLLFGSSVERMLDHFAEKDPEAMTQWAKDVLVQGTPPFVPSIALPFVEDVANWSFWQNRPLAPPSSLLLPPAEQARESTSGIMRRLGEAVNYSPAKLENYWRDWTAGTGGLILDGLDQLLAKPMAGVTPPASTWADQPIVRRFIVRFPSSQARSIEDFYTLLKQASVAARELNHLAKSSGAMSFDVYQAAHPEAAWAGTLQDVNAGIRQLWDFQRDIRADPRWSADEKRALLDTLQEEQIEAAQQAVRQVREWEKTP